MAKTINYIGVVDDNKTMSDTFLYRVNYGDFSVQIESVEELTEQQMVERADAIIDSYDEIEEQG